MFTKRRKPKQATQVMTPREAEAIIRQDNLDWLKRQFPIVAEFRMYREDNSGEWTTSKVVEFKVRFLDSERWELIDE